MLQIPSDSVAHIHVQSPVMYIIQIYKNLWIFSMYSAMM